MPSESFPWLWQTAGFSGSDGRDSTITRTASLLAYGRRRSCSIYLLKPSTGSSNPGYTGGSFPLP
jgi:hypothetical protein